MPDGATTEWPGKLGQAMVWHRFLVTGDPITDDLIKHIEHSEHIVDEILIPAPGSREDVRKPSGRAH